MKTEIKNTCKTASNLNPLNINGLPHWFGELQLKSRENWMKQGLPTRQEEAWKYLNLSELTEILPNLVQPQKKMLDKEFIKKLRFNHSYLLVLIDGDFSKELSDLPKNIEVMNLAEMLSQDNIAIINHFKQNTNPAWDKFSAFNLTSLNAGIYINIASHTVLDKPLQCLDIRSSDNMCLSTRKIICVGAHSHLSIVHQIQSSADIRYFNLENTDMVLGEDSQFNYYVLQEESSCALSFVNTNIDLQSKAKFNRFELSTGGKLTRHDVWVNAKEDSFCQLQGLYLLNHTQSSNHHLVLNHQSPCAKSLQDYRGILTDSAEENFNSQVKVQPAAQKIDSRQLNKNLLLSSKAQVNTKPELEIYADDVRCAHGATVGELDHEALFYLMARGIASDQARLMLMRGFCHRLWENMADQAIREKFQAWSEQKIQQMVQ